MEKKVTKMQELKLRIKQLRTMLNMSMAEFAASINVSAGNVGDWESIKRASVPSASALKSIAEKFNVSLEWLLFGYEKTDRQYSERVSGKFAANSLAYEELVSIALRLDEAGLIQLLKWAKELDSGNKPKRENKQTS